jgi:plastocyanin
MSRIRIALAAAGVALVLVPTAPGSAKTLPKLVGTVGRADAFTITLTKAGRRVTKLKAGKYTVVVRDLSTIHNFHLVGRGVNKTTSVGAKVTRTWTLTLKKGTYRYRCDAHVSTMTRSFKVV